MDPKRTQNNNFIDSCLKIDSFYPQKWQKRPNLPWMSTDLGHITFFGITYKQTIDFHWIWGVSFSFRTFHPFEHGVKYGQGREKMDCFPKNFGFHVGK